MHALDEQTRFVEGRLPENVRGARGGCGRLRTVPQSVDNDERGLMVSLRQAPGVAAFRLAFHGGADRAEAAAVCLTHARHDRRAAADDRGNVELRGKTLDRT